MVNSSCCTVSMIGQILTLVAALGHSVHLPYPEIWITLLDVEFRGGIECNHPSLPSMQGLFVPSVLGFLQEINLSHAIILGCPFNSRLSEKAEPEWKPYFQNGGLQILMFELLWLHPYLDVVNTLPGQTGFPAAMTQASHAGNVEVLLHSGNIWCIDKARNWAGRRGRRQG